MSASRTDAEEIEAQIDPRQALAALGYEETSEPQRVTGGWDTLLWRFATPDGREHSLRVHVLPHREEIAWRERVALEICNKEGLPAPRVEAAGEFNGLPATVLSWCPGRPLLTVIEKQPWSMWRLGRLFGETQARVHAVASPPQFVARGPQDWLLRLDERYAHLAAGVLSLEPAATSLIHMDFHPLNLITDGATVTGIVDWEGAAAGDPRADLARTVVTILAAPVPPGPLRPALNLARKLMLRAWRSGYEAAAGRMPDYRPFMAWAGATFLAEFELVLHRPGVWGTERDMETLRRQVEVWEREAGAH